MNPVLFLDDSRARHNEFLTMCKTQNWRPTHAYSVGEFIRMLAERVYDIIFLDHDLGTGCPDGKAAVEELVRLEESKRPSLVVVHSRNEPEARKMTQTLAKAGFRVLRNPFRID